MAPVIAKARYCGLFLFDGRGQGTTLSPPHSVSNPSYTGDWTPTSGYGGPGSALSAAAAAAFLELVPWAGSATPVAHAARATGFVSTTT